MNQVQILRLLLNVFLLQTLQRECASMLLVRLCLRLLFLGEFHVSQVLMLHAKPV